MIFIDSNFSQRKNIRSVSKLSFSLRVFSDLNHHRQRKKKVGELWILHISLIFLAKEYIWKMDLMQIVLSTNCECHSGLMQMKATHSQTQPSEFHKDLSEMIAAVVLQQRIQL